MTPYKQGDGVLVPFPFTDLSAAKQRPAIIISADLFNRSRPDCVLAAITSQIPVTVARDEMLLAVDDLQCAGLPKSSLVRCGKVITIQQTLIRKRPGVLPPATVRTVLNDVRSVLSTR